MSAATDTTESQLAGDRFLAKLARMLHEAGTPAHRLEGLVTSCADRLGLKVCVFSLPTSINIGIGEEGAQRVMTFRVDPGSPKLAMLEEAYKVADRVARGELDAAGGITALDRARARIRPPTALVNCAGYALFSAGAAVFLGGSWADMAAALPVGFVVGGSIALSVGRRERELLAEFAAAAIGTIIAAFVAHLFQNAGLESSPAIVSLAGLVTLLPGLSLATAMSELSTRNLASGSARLIGAITTLVVVGMGAAIGDRLAVWMNLPQHTAFVVPTSQVAEITPRLVCALLAISMGLVIAFQARPRRAPIVVLSCVVGWLAIRTGRQWLGADVAPVIAAAAIGITGNIYARVRRRPTLAIVLPGLALLLPGSIGFRGMQGIIASDTVAGLNTAIGAMIVAASIAAGLLIANAVLPSPRHV